MYSCCFLLDETGQVWTKTKTWVSRVAVLSPGSHHNLIYCPLAYCIVNHKEFFSELSVTFLADAYHEFDAEETQMEKCCPPLMAPTVVERVRLKGYNVIRVEEGSVHSNGSLSPLIEPKQTLDKQVATKVRWPVTDSIRGVWQLLSRRDSDSMRAKIPHCNKFYPFTKGQLEKHDPDLFAVYTDLWTQIEAWHDEAGEKSCLRLRSCWPK